MHVVLASSSPYRKKLLAQIHIPAICSAPNIDETPYPNEAPEALAMRLAISKAQAITEPNAIIIGSDQVASLNGQLLGKPGNKAGAYVQLQQQAGQEVIFYTALCLRYEQKLLTDVVTTTVRFRALSPEEITQYLTLESPFDCAGSFKCEGLGISLFESIKSDDPSALIGLPLIKTAQFLRELGVNPLQALT
jgi:septum formation protein